MKKISIMIFLCIAQISFAQDKSQSCPKFPLHQQDVPGVTEQYVGGEGRGMLCFAFHHSENQIVDFGVADGVFSEVSGTMIIPLYAAVKKDFWTYDVNGYIHGSVFAFAGAGPALGFWSDPSSFSNFFSSLAFRPGASGIASINADFGIARTGFVIVAGAGFNGFAFTGTIGPRMTFGGAFYSIGMRIPFGK